MSGTLHGRNSDFGRAVRTAFILAPTVSLKIHRLGAGVCVQVVFPNLHEAFQKLHSAIRKADRGALTVFQCKRKLPMPTRIQFNLDNWTGCDHCIEEARSVFDRVVAGIDSDFRTPLAIVAVAGQNAVVIKLALEATDVVKHNLALVGTLFESDDYSIKTPLQRVLRGKMLKAKNKAMLWCNVLPVALAEYAAQACEACGRKDKLFMCTACCTACYCGPECQAARWEAHQALCPGFKELYNLHLKDDVITI